MTFEVKLCHLGLKEYLKSFLSALGHEIMTVGFWGLKFLLLWRHYLVRDYGYVPLL